MTDPDFDRIRRLAQAPVAPDEGFARSLLEYLEGVARTERQAIATGLTSDQIDAQSGEELPLREAMSLISPDPMMPLEAGCVLEVEPPIAPDPS